MAVKSPRRRLLINIFDKLLFVLVIPSALILKLYRRLGSQDMKLSSLILKKIGVFPIRNHYYEPLFKFSDNDKKLLVNRKLPGIKFNVDDQLNFLENFIYKDELLEMDLKKTHLKF